MTTKPKPVRMWAVYSPKGRPVLHTISGSKNASKVALCSRYGLDPVTLFDEEGYTVRRVTITPDPESEKRDE